MAKPMGKQPKAYDAAPDDPWPSDDPDPGSPDDLEAMCGDTDSLDMGPETLARYKRQHARGELGDAALARMTKMTKRQVHGKY